MSRSPLYVLNHLDSELGQLLSAHHSRPEVITVKTKAPWEIDPRADVLITAPSAGWGRAPALPPPDWPGGLQWLHTISAGIDVYPRWLGNKLSISSGKGVSSPAIADFVMQSISRICALRKGGSSPQYEVVGIAGYGTIGKEVAWRSLAKGYPVKVLRRGLAARSENGIDFLCDLTQLASQVDHLVLVLPITPETRQIVNAALLGACRTGVHLINVARGGLVDHEALCAALDNGSVGYATLDVTDPEPLPDGHSLRGRSNVFLTPHSSWESPDHIVRRNSQILRNLDAFCAGRSLEGRVDIARGY